MRCTTDMAKIFDNSHTQVDVGSSMLLHRSPLSLHKITMNKQPSTGPCNCWPLAIQFITGTAAPSALPSFSFPCCNRGKSTSYSATASDAQMFLKSLLNPRCLFMRVPYLMPKFSSTGTRRERKGVDAAKTCARIKATMSRHRRFQLSPTSTLPLGGRSRAEN